MEEKRLWIGNLPLKVTEYQLLKLLQKYGTIKKFDLLFNRTGPQAGQPRGYAFVTYMKNEEAISAMAKLNNALLGDRHITVTWAHRINTEEVENPKPPVFIPALAISKTGQKTDTDVKIQAIEAKLKMMEKNNEDELKINDTVATKPAVIAQYQYNKQHSSQLDDDLLKKKSNVVRRNDRFNSKPYVRHKQRR